VHEVTTVQEKNISSPLPPTRPSRMNDIADMETETVKARHVAYRAIFGRAWSPSPPTIKAYRDMLTTSSMKEHVFLGKNERSYFVEELSWKGFINFNRFVFHYICFHEYCFIEIVSFHPRLVCRRLSDAFTQRCARMSHC